MKSLRFRFIRSNLILIIIIVLAFLLNSSVVNAQTSSGTNPQCKTIPEIVDVHINTYFEEWPGDLDAPVIRTVAYEEYVWGVVLGELGPQTPQAAGQYSGTLWDKQTLRAQSIAARTAGAYKCQNLTDTNPQTYRPYYGADNGVGGADTNRFKNQAGFTKGMYLTWDGVTIQSPFNGVLMDAQYRDDTGNPSCSWSNGTETRNACKVNGQAVANYNYLVSVDNPFAVATSGPGWGQISAHIWRKSGNKKSSYVDLLHKYYTGVYIQNNNPFNISREFYNGYNSIGCTGPVVYSSIVKTINSFWTGSPADGVNADNFCVRWTGTASIPAQTWYTIYVLRDDGMRVWVDNSLILDTWSNSSLKLETVSIFLGSGDHALKVEMYDAGFDAVARFSLTRGIGMVGKYFNRRINVTENPNDFVMIRPDILSMFDWITTSPLDPSNLEPNAPSISSNNFSVIWEGRIHLQGDATTCQYIQFKARVDDGGFVRMWHDPYGGAQDDVINAWFDQGVTPYQGTRWLCGGTYRVEARYYESAGNAVANFWWQKTTEPESDDPTLE